jgi:hypothetical protein
MIKSLKDYILGSKPLKNVEMLNGEINEGRFKMDISDHILHLKSFIDKDLCNEVINGLKLLNSSDQYCAPYSTLKGTISGKINNIESYFNPEIDALERIKSKIFNDAVKIYADRVRSFNWAYLGTDRFHSSEMIVRKYYPESQLDYHHDDVILEVYPKWFPKRRLVLTVNIYFNDEYEGGGLHFTPNDKIYYPSTGDVILSPTNWMFYHKVKEITSGTRYSGTYWFYYGSHRRMI